MSINELKTAKEQVAYLLEKYPYTRDNDFYLYYLYLKHFKGLNQLPFLDFEVIKKVSGSAATVRRVRAKIQNDEGRFLPNDPKVKWRRMRREKDFRKNINKV